MGVVEAHQGSMRPVLSCLQDMEEKRGLCFHDTAMKIAVYDTSWLRNVQYDLDGGVQAMESKEPTEVIQEFIAQHQSQAATPAPLVLQSYSQLAADLGTKVESAWSSSG